MTEFTPDAAEECIDLCNRINALVEDALDEGVLIEAAITAIVTSLWLRLPLLRMTNEKTIELVCNHLKRLAKKKEEAND